MWRHDRVARRQWRGPSALWRRRNGAARRRLPGPATAWPRGRLQQRRTMAVAWAGNGHDSVACRQWRSPSALWRHDTSAIAARDLNRRGRHGPGGPGRGCRPSPFAFHLVVSCQVAFASRANLPHNRICAHCTARSTLQICLKWAAPKIKKKIDLICFLPLTGSSKGINSRTRKGTPQRTRCKRATHLTPTTTANHQKRKDGIGVP